MNILPGTHLGRYEVLSKLGAGAMGDVYLAHDSNLSRTVALKVLPHELSSDEGRMLRFSQEARAISALNHPNIITIHEVAHIDSTHFIAVEFVKGLTLRERLDEEQIPTKDIIDIAEQVAQALAAAHEAGIVHRDLKPENIMVRHDGYVKVLDFGIAKLSEQPAIPVGTAVISDSREGTKAGALLGTPSYMSPEQCRGASNLDARSDIWSLGVVLFEMVTGRLPFRAKDFSQLLVLIAGPKDPPLELLRPKAPPGLERIIGKALQKKRKARFQTASELASDLRDLKFELALEEKVRTSQGRSDGALSNLLNLSEIRLDKSHHTEHPTLQISSPTTTPEVHPNNLSVLLNPLIGREAEVVAIKKLLLDDDVRLVTLTGPGGTGKSSLGLRLAREFLDEFQHGVFFVALTAITDPALVAPTIAQVLGIKEERGVSLLDAMKGFFRAKRILVVLDNFEQVISAAPLITDLLSSSPELEFLVTSRAALHLSGEHEFPVAPLSLPDPKRLPPWTQLAQYSSIALFVSRAQAIKPDFVLNEDNASAVAEICCRLDGLPLAIELSAARIKLLPPAAMLKRMESSLKILTGGARDLPARQQTMRGAIAWSYDLLEGDERTLFNRLSVFLGGCSLEEAEAVCNSTGDLEIDLLDGVTSLVDKSLLRQKEQDAEGRFSMLQTIREFGLEQLAQSGELEAIRAQHLAYYLELAEQAEPELTGALQASWFSRLEKEHDNFRASLVYSQESGRLEEGLRMAGALWRWWEVRGHVGEGRAVLDQLLNLRGAGDVAPNVRAKALNGAGVLAGNQGDHARQTAILQESLKLYEELDDKSGIAQSINNLGSIAYSQGDYARAQSFYTESLELRRAISDSWGIANSLNNLGGVAFLQGDCERALSLHSESLSLRRTLGDKRGISMSLNNMGEVAQQQQDFGKAAMLFAESLAIRNELGDRFFIVSSLHNLAEVACSRNDYERGARLFGAAEALREMIGAPLPTEKRENFDRYVGEARDALGRADLKAFWSEGRVMSLEDAIDYALSKDNASEDRGLKADARHP